MILIAVLEFDMHAGPAAAAAAAAKPANEQALQGGIQAGGSIIRPQYPLINTHEATTTAEIEPNAPHNVECVTIQVV